MKLCPQCEFIYEDSQALCDMDGQELVYEPTISMSSGKSPADAGVKVARSRRRGMPIRILAGLVLVAGLLLTYQVFTPESETVKVNALSARKDDPTTATLPAAVAPPEKIVTPAGTPDLSKGNAVSEAAQQAAQAVPDNSSTPNPTDSKSPNNHAVATKEPAAFSVYALPRVKPLPALKPIPKLAARDAPRMSTTQKRVVENKKKDSKVSSFFKKTARVLSKPFQR